MPGRRIWFARRCSWVAPLALVAACAGEATAPPEDVPASDLGVVNDLARDAVLDDRSDVEVGMTDSGVDSGTRDAAVDARPDVPGVMLGGFFIPVDPNAVPPPGSECVGDGGVREGDPTIAPPRPIRPLSVSRVTSQRPTFQWALPEGTTGARVEVCADRCCTRVLQTFDAEGTTTRPMMALPPGVVFWRMFGRRGTVVGSRASYTWEFGVRRRDAPNDTSWGTIRDFNGDGYDDLVVVAHRSASESDRTSEALLVPGSERGLQPPVRSGVINPRLPDTGSAGDFNGDGIADIVWSNRMSDSSRDSWVEVLRGGGDGLRRVARLNAHGPEGCPDPFLAWAVDWNGDGYSDIVVSVTYGCDIFSVPDAAFLFLFHGSPRGVASVPQEVVRVDNLFLHRQAFADNVLGDVDLDGYGDLYMISRFSGSGTTSVRAEHAIAYGGPVGPPRYERLGVPLRTDIGLSTPLGDVDGDGHGDWALWLESWWTLNVYRYSSGRNAPSEVIVDTVSRYPGREFGVSSGGADLNGDGLSDVFVSAADAFDDISGGLPVGYGRVYVYSGLVGGISRMPSVVLPPQAEDGGVGTDSFGWGAMSPGDVNGDGVDDLVMGHLDRRSICFVFGRVGAIAPRPNGCAAGWWPSYERYL